METTDKPSVSLLPVSTLTIGGTVIVIDVRIHHVATSYLKQDTSEVRAIGANTQRFFFLLHRIQLD